MDKWFGEKTFHVDEFKKDETNLEESNFINFDLKFENASSSSKNQKMVIKS